MLTFKTNAEKEEALNAIVTDPPPGVNVDDFATETEAKIDEIMSATIEENAPPVDEPNQGDPSQDDIIRVPEGASKEPVHPTPPSQNPPNGNPPANGDSELDRLQRNNQYLQQQHMTQSRENNTKITELQTQIEELKKSTPANAPTPKNKTAVSETDHEIIAVQNEIINLEKEMNSVDDDDLESSQVLSFTKKSNQLSLKLTSLNQKRQDALIAEQRSAEEARKNKDRIERDNQAKKLAEETKNKEIDAFSLSMDELKTKSKYEELDIAYGEFGREVASVYFNITPDKARSNDVEVAMQQYLSGNAILNEALKNRGIKEPSELRKFVLLSEIDALKKGFVLDKLTGEFVPFTDSSGRRVNFPSHKSAYLYLQNEKGQTGVDILKAQESTAQNVMHAITRKAGAIELSQEEQRQLNIDEMTKERAESIIGKYSTDDIAIRARKNFDDPLVSEYNKALNKLGYATLDRSDVS